MSTFEVQGLPLYIDDGSCVLPLTWHMSSALCV
jgi:hypothetical protein